MLHRIHLDTDLGGDPDDLCALVMLLGRPDVHITGITTTQDDDGQRAGYLRYILTMLGREEIPVASGARKSLTTGKIAAPFTGDTRYWPDPVEPTLSGAADAIDLLETSIRGGATIACIGPVTNLAMFETFRGGMLRNRRVVVMGGYITPPDPGYPQWGPEHDWNVQWDTRAMETLVNTDAHLTLVPYPVTMHAPIRERDLAGIESTSEIGALIARQCRARAEDAHIGDIGKKYPSLPDDLLNFLYDPIAAIVALDWARAKRQEMQLMPYIENGIMSFESSPLGRNVEVITGIDGEGFRNHFLDCVQFAASGRRKD
jgi:purine nucleosidase